MKTYEVISECIIAGRRISPPGPVELTDEQAEWGRAAGVIGDEIAPEKEPAKGKGKK